MSRNPRGTLTPERIVDAALVLADRDGLEALTMRGLAAELGARPMSLYHHVATKEALLAAVVDRVFDEIAAPRADRPWREELAGRARSMRRALAAHPWSLRVMEAQRSPGRASLAQHEAVLETLRSQGFALREASHAYAVLDAFVYGFALQESMLAGAGLMEAPGALIQGMDLAASPRIAELAVLYTDGDSPAEVFGDSFEVGLEMVLAGIAQLRD